MSAISNKQSPAASQSIALFTSEPLGSAATDGAATSGVVGFSGGAFAGKVDPATSVFPDGAEGSVAIASELVEPLFMVGCGL